MQRKDKIICKKKKKKKENLSLSLSLSLGLVPLSFKKSTQRCLLHPVCISAAARTCVTMEFSFISFDVKSGFLVEAITTE